MKLSQEIRRIADPIDKAIRLTLPHLKHLDDPTWHKIVAAHQEALQRVAYCIGRAERQETERDVECTNVASVTANVPSKDGALRCFC